MARSRKGLVLLALPVFVAAGSAVGLRAWLAEPELASSPLVRAQELFDAGNLREAEKLLIGRPSTDARYLLGRIYVKLGLLEDARDLLESVVPEREEARGLLVKVCLDRGDFHRALPHVRALAASDKAQRPELLKLVAHCEQKLGNPTSALAAANEALTLAPNDPAAGQLVAELVSAISTSISGSPATGRGLPGRHPTPGFKGASPWIPSPPSWPR